MKAIGVLSALVLALQFVAGAALSGGYVQDEEQIETGALRPQAGVGRVLVPVPRVTIYPGDVITNDMLADRDFAAEGLQVPEVFAPREAMIGKVSKKTLLPNVPVSASNLREPYLIKQGQATVVVFKQEGLVILATAVPLEAGSVGDFIKLRNVIAERPFTASCSRTGR